MKTNLIIVGSFLLGFSPSLLAQCNVFPINTGVALEDQSVNTMIIVTTRHPDSSFEQTVTGSDNSSFPGDECPDGGTVHYATNNMQASTATFSFQRNPDQSYTIRTVHCTYQRCCSGWGGNLYFDVGDASTNICSYGR